MGKIRKQIWQCSQLNGTFPVEIPSESESDKIYIVHVNPWANRSEQHSCQCGSYRYKHYCKHQRIAHSMICGWNEIQSRIPISEFHKQNNICPQCGGSITQAIWEIEE